MKSTLRTLGVLGVIGVATGIVALNGLAADAAEPKSGNIIGVPDVIAQRPVLDYDVTGGTLAGPIHFRLTVYDNGHASISMSEESWIIVPNEECPPNGRATHTGVTLEEIEELKDALFAAGAYQATNGGQASDTPLQTVTVYRSRGDNQVAHSFSFFWGSTPEIEATVEVIHAFIDEHFPEF